MKRIGNCKGEGYVDTAILVLVVIMLLALAVKVIPVFSTKNILNHYANELVRKAEIEGCLNANISSEIEQLNETTGISPIIVWNNSYITDTNKVQLNDSISATLTYSVDIGFFRFGSFPITLTSKATGKSEVFWK